MGRGGERGDQRGGQRNKAGGRFGTARGLMGVHRHRGAVKELERASRFSSEEREIGLGRKAACIILRGCFDRMQKRNFCRKLIDIYPR